MKEELRLVLIGIFVMLFQVLMAHRLSFMGLIPNLFISYVVLFSFYMRFKSRVWILYVIGLGYDLFNPLTLGLNSLIFLLIYMTSVRYYDVLSERNIASHYINLLLSNFIYIIFLFFFYTAIDTTSTLNLKNLFQFYLYNTLLNLVFFSLLKLFYNIKFRIDE